MSSVLYDVPGPKAIARNRIIAAMILLAQCENPVETLQRFQQEARPRRGK